MKACLLGLKAVCDDCGACEEDRCDLDPNKLCDNCFKCLEITQSYREIPIGRMLMDSSGGGELYAIVDDEPLEPEMDLNLEQGDSTGGPDDLEWYPPEA